MTINEKKIKLYPQTNNPKTNNQSVTLQTNNPKTNNQSLTKLR